MTTATHSDFSTKIINDLNEFLQAYIPQNEISQIVSFVEHAKEHQQINLAQAIELSCQVWSRFLKENYAKLLVILFKAERLKKNEKFSDTAKFLNNTTNNFCNLVDRTSCLRFLLDIAIERITVKETAYLAVLSKILPKLIDNRLDYWEFYGILQSIDIALENEMYEFANWYIKTLPALTNEVSTQVIDELTKYSTPDAIQGKNALSRLVSKQVGKNYYTKMEDFLKRRLQVHDFFNFFGNNCLEWDADTDEHLLNVIAGTSWVDTGNYNRLVKFILNYLDDRSFDNKMIKSTLDDIQLILVSQPNDVAIRILDRVYKSYETHGIKALVCALLAKAEGMQEEYSGIEKELLALIEFMKENYARDVFRGQICEDVDGCDTSSLDAVDNTLLTVFCNKYIDFVLENNSKDSQHLTKQLELMISSKSHNFQDLYEFIDNFANMLKVVRIENRFKKEDENDIWKWYGIY